MSVFLGLAASVQNSARGLQTFGSPREVLALLEEQGLVFADLMLEPETALEVQEIYQAGPKVTIRGGPHAGALLNLLEYVESGGDPPPRSAARVFRLGDRAQGSELPLVVAAAAGAIRQVEVLLNLGADPQRTGPLGMTPLHWAAAKGHLPVALRLRDAGTDPLSVNWFLLTPSELAIIHGHESVATALGPTGTAAVETLPEVTVERMSRPSTGRTTMQ